MPEPDTETGERRIAQRPTVQVGGDRETTSVVAGTDAGSTRTTVEATFAAEVGARPVSQPQPMAAEDAAPTTVVDLVVGVNGNPHVVPASVVDSADRCDADPPIVLGHDVLQYYEVNEEQAPDAIDDASPEAASR